MKTDYEKFVAETDTNRVIEKVRQLLYTVLPDYQSEDEDYDMLDMIDTFIRKTIEPK